MSAEAERWREVTRRDRPYTRVERDYKKAGDDLAAALEAAKEALVSATVHLEAHHRRVAELEAGVYRIQRLTWHPTGRLREDVAEIARDLLEGRAAGGEG